MKMIGFLFCSFPGRVLSPVIIASGGTPHQEKQHERIGLSVTQVSRSRWRLVIKLRLRLVITDKDNDCDEHVNNLINRPGIDNNSIDREELKISRRPSSRVCLSVFLVSVARLEKKSEEKEGWTELNEQRMRLRPLQQNGNL